MQKRSCLLWRSTNRAAVTRGLRLSNQAVEAKWTRLACSSFLKCQERFAKVKTKLKMHLLMAKTKTEKMPMTCHNLSPQKTTVSDVTGSGFFGGSVGKSYETIHFLQHLQNIWPIYWAISQCYFKWKQFMGSQYFRTPLCVANMLFINN